MEKEAEKQSFTMPVTKALERAAEATRVSLCTIKNIKREGLHVTASEGCFETPNKIRHRVKPAVDLDTFDSEVIRRTMYEFYKTEK